MHQIPELKKAIRDKFKSEAACSRRLGWHRQRLNKITNGSKEPSVYELNEISNILGIPLGKLVPLFLPKKSPIRQFPPQ